MSLHESMILTWLTSFVLAASLLLWSTREQRAAAPTHRER